MADTSVSEWRNIRRRIVKVQKKEVTKYHNGKEYSSYYYILSLNVYLPKGFVEVNNVKEYELVMDLDTGEIFLHPIRSSS